MKKVLIKALNRIKSIITFLLNLKNIKYYFSQIIIILVPILFVIFPNWASYVKNNWLTITSFIAFMSLCVYFSVDTSLKLVEKIETIREIEHKNISLTTFLQTTPERVIKSIFNYLDFGYTERISVYRYEDSHFIRIGRYSKNAEYKKSGRERYPFDEGFIGLAWQQGEYFKDELPDPNRKLKGYINEVQGICNIEEETIINMRMKSRSYFCINLDDLSGDPIAVIVFESTNEKLPIEISEIKHLLESSFGHLIVEVINMSIPPGRRDE